MTRPIRQKQHDRLMHHGATSAQVQCDLALAPFDRECRRLDVKWGQDRLVELVSPETAAKWGAAMANLNAAIASDDPQLVVARVNACLRGFAAMDAEATAAGHQPIVPDAWEFQIDGKTCALLRDDAAWPAYSAARLGVRVYTMREVANALAAYGQTVAAAKDAFPGAQVVAVRQPTKLEIELNDEVPF